ncbi:MAG: hypothetical protein ABSD43_06600 [Terracidiphilus sp.]|jgi:hypothetical protein
MKIVAKVSRGFGIACFLCAGLLLMMMYDDHHSGAWFPNLLDDLVWQMVAVLVVLGLGGIIFAYRSERADRDPVEGLGLGTDLDKKDDEI